MTTDRTTRKPTGKPTYPFLAVAGLPGMGKTCAVLEASALPWIGRFFLVELGESDGDQYGALPGVDYEIVPHDGSYPDVLAAMQWASDQPRVHPDKPNAIALDSGTALWDLLVDEQNVIARQRATRKAANNKAPAWQREKAAVQASGEVEPEVGREQWNSAKTRWNRAIRVLRQHEGPTFITARAEEVSGTDANGNPTKTTEVKIKAEKTLPFACTGVILFEKYRRPSVMKMNLLNLHVDAEDRNVPMREGIAGLFEQAGISPATVGQRSYVEPDAHSGAGEQHADGQEVADAIAHAIAGPNASMELRRIAGLYGGPTGLALVTISTADGDRSGVEVMGAAIREAERREQQDAGPVSAQRPAAVSAQGARVAQPAPVSPVVVERAPQAVAAQARVDEGARRAQDAARKALVKMADEVTELLVPTVPRFGDELAEFLWEQQVGALLDADPQAVRRWAFPRREVAVAALREQGRGPEAEAYQEAARAGRIDTAAGLLGVEVAPTGR